MTTTTPVPLSGAREAGARLVVLRAAVAPTGVLPDAMTVEETMAVAARAEVAALEILEAPRVVEPEAVDPMIVERMVNGLAVNGPAGVDPAVNGLAAAAVGAIRVEDVILGAAEVTSEDARVAPAQMTAAMADGAATRRGSVVRERFPKARTAGGVLHARAPIQLDATTAEASPSHVI